MSTKDITLAMLRNPNHFKEQCVSNGYWITNKYDLIPIEELTTEHIKNILNKFKYLRLTNLEKELNNRNK